MDPPCSVFFTPDPGLERSRSSVGKLLTEFEGKRLLDRRYGRLSVQDVKALQRMMEIESPDASG